MSDNNKYVTIATKNNQVDNVLIGTEKECMDHFHYLKDAYNGDQIEIVMVKQTNGFYEVMAKYEMPEKKDKNHEKESY